MPTAAELTHPHSLLTSLNDVCRGKFRSKPWQQLLDEAKYLVDTGVKELNLIAEDTNQYGQDRRDGKGLAQLMHELGKLEGLQWMRILYAYPSYFTEDLIDEIANNPKVVTCHAPDADYFLLDCKSVQSRCYKGQGSLMSQFLMPHEPCFNLTHRPLQFVACTTWQASTDRQCIWHKYNLLRSNPLVNRALSV